MSWGVRSQNDDIQPTRKPEQVDLTQDTGAGAHPTLQGLHQAVDIARAGELPGTPTDMVNTISVTGYEPPEGAIKSALGS